MIGDWWARNIDGIEVEMSESLEATMNPLVDVVISTVRIGRRAFRIGGRCSPISDRIGAYTH